MRAMLDVLVMFVMIRQPSHFEIDPASSEADCP